MPNRRIYYALQQLMIAPDGTTGYGGGAYIVHGLQTVGINTRFNLEQIFEQGQLALYQQIENIPDVEVSCEKVLDGYPLVYHLSTPTATSADLAGRSNSKCQLLFTVYNDNQSGAYGTQISEVEMSGMFVSQIGYNFQVNGAFTESVTLVGNNKNCRSSAFKGSGYLLSGAQDSPVATSGIARRHNIIFGSGTGASILPTGIRGITASGGTGWNLQGVTGYDVSFQSIRVSAQLGRDALLELGRRGAYFRPVQFPVNIRTEMEVIAKDVDFINANEASDNTTDERIVLRLQYGTTPNMFIDLGTKNRLESVNYGNANAGNNGGNASITYSYTTFNDFKVIHQSDPAGFTS